MAFRIVLSLLLFLGTSGVAQAMLNDIKSFGHLKQLIQDREIRSVDQLLENLPDRYRKGHTLIYNTQALGQHLVSPARPRILFFGTTGEFMMTINSHPSGGKAPVGDLEKVETIEFVGDRTYLREIEFDGVNSPFSKTIETNPARCLTCHGSDPRGLWDPYNMWPGVYGSLSRGRVDFIAFDSPEYHNFQTFLEERKTNLRYSFTHSEFKKLSELDPKTVLIPYNPEKMKRDALVIQDGHTTFPNQIIGMVIGDFNLRRLGRILNDTPLRTRERLQYLFEAIRRDEAAFLAQKDFIDLKKFQHNCSKDLASFFPEPYTWQKVSYPDFHKLAMEMNSQDHFRQKKIVNLFNFGLSGKLTDFDENDPFDFNVDASGVSYAPVSLTHIWDRFFKGRQTASFLAYVFYLSGLPYQELSTAINAGRFNLYYGNSIECSGNVDNSGSRKCFYHGVDIFFERFLPKTYFIDSQIQKMSCEELAQKSRDSLAGDR